MEIPPLDYQIAGLTQRGRFSFCGDDYTAVCGEVERTVVVNLADQMVGLAAGIIG